MIPNEDALSSIYTALDNETNQEEFNRKLLQFIYDTRYGRIQTLEDEPEIIPDFDNYDGIVLTTQNQNLEIKNPIGTIKDGQEFFIRVHWNDSFTYIWEDKYFGTDLLNLPVSAYHGGFTDYFLFKWNEENLVMQCINQQLGLRTA